MRNWWGCRAEDSRLPLRSGRRTYPPAVVDIEHEVFAVPAPSGWEPRLDAEHTEHRWASLDEARGIFHWDDTRAAFDILRGRLAEVQRGG